HPTLRFPMLPIRRIALCFGLSLLLAAGRCDDAAEEANEGAGTGDLTLPSGRIVSLQDVISNAQGVEGATARFRFVQAGLKPEEDVSDDLHYLCGTYAKERTEGMVPPPMQIVVSIADRPVPFGEIMPEAVQF